MLDTCKITGFADEIHRDLDVQLQVLAELNQKYIELRGAAGVYLRELEVRTRACRVEAVGKYTFKIILTQGLNRQIRRMCKELGYEVTSLKRVRVMNIKLNKLAPGQFREVTGEELEQLYRLAGM